MSLNVWVRLDKWAEKGRQGCFAGVGGCTELGWSWQDMFLVLHETQDRNSMTCLVREARLSPCIDSLLSRARSWLEIDVLLRRSKYYVADSF
jgi:hypothetical protein